MTHAYLHESARQRAVVGSGHSVALVRAWGVGLSVARAAARERQTHLAHTLAPVHFGRLFYRRSSGPLLLVADRYRSGWAVTGAAGLLREAGAGAVLPLVLHQAP